MKIIENFSEGKQRRNLFWKARQAIKAKKDLYSEKDIEQLYQLSLLIYDVDLEEGERICESIVKNI